MNADPAPPRALRALLRRALPIGLRDDVLADLDSSFARRVRDQGLSDGRRWYRRQSVHELRAALSERWLRRHATPGGSPPPRLPAPRKPSVSSLLQDLRFALRWLRRQPVFTVAVIATLALGIGANTAIFTVINAVLLRPLPYADPDRIVRLYNGSPEEPDVRNPASLNEAVEYRRLGAAGIEAIAAFDVRDVNLTGLEEPLRLPATLVTAEFFDVFGVTAQLGRTFLPEEDLPGGDDVVILSDGFWRRAWAADPGAVGSEIRINGRTRRIVGIMPPTFDFYAGSDLWIPRAYDVDVLGPETALSHNQNFVAKLEEGVSVEAATETMTATIQRVLERYPSHDWQHAAYLIPLDEWTTARVRPTLAALAGAVGLLLLVACANVANLLLGRAAARQQEVAVRAALGAGRGRIVRQMLVESLLLATLGGALGVLLARVLLGALLAILPTNLPRASEIAVDGTVLLFGLVLSLLTGLAFGIFPALRTASRAPADTLRSAGERTAARSGGMSTVLVVAEVTLVVALLLGAGLMLRTVQRLLHVDTGLDLAGTVAFRVELPETSYPAEAEIVPFFEGLMARIETLPGVAAVGADSWLPYLDSWSNWGIEVDGRELDMEAGIPDYHSVAGDWFDAIGNPILRGRGLDPANPGEEVVISELAVERYFPDVDPIGQRLRLTGEPGWRTVVGITGDYRNRGLSEPAVPVVYVGHETLAFGGDPWIASRMGIVVRTNGDPMAIAAALREQVRSLDPTLPIQDLRPMEEVVDDLVASPRFTAVLLSAFAAGALLLGAIGIYGVLSTAVAARRREIGIRQAMGARRGDLLAMVFRRGAGTVAIGIGAGLLLGFWAARALMVTLLFETSPFDPVTVVGVVGTIGAAATLAILVPARRATRIDPATALRTD